LRPVKIDAEGYLEWRATVKRHSGAAVAGPASCECAGRDGVTTRFGRCGREVRIDFSDENFYGRPPAPAAKGADYRQGSAPGAGTRKTVAEARPLRHLHSCRVNEINRLAQELGSGLQAH
jgi:hypothetical protein